MMDAVTLWAVGLVGFVVGYITGGSFKDQKFTDHGRECYKRGYKRAVWDSQPSTEPWLRVNEDRCTSDDLYDNPDNIGRA